MVVVVGMEVTVSVILLTVVEIAVVPLSIGLVDGILEVTFASVPVMLLTVVEITVVPLSI